MKAKFLLSLFVVLLAGLAIAATFTTSTSSITLTPGVNTTTFTLSSSNATNVNLALSLNYPDSTAMPVTLSSTSLAINSTPSIVTLNSQIDYSKLDLGKLVTGNILVSNQANAADNSTITLNVQKTFCELGQKGSGLRITRVLDQNLDNEDDFEWNLLDNVELEVRIENTLDDEIDAVLEFKLVDSDGNEVDLDQDSIDVTIADDDSEEVTIAFQIPADDSALDFSSSSKNFKLYIKAYEDGNEDEQCTDRKYASSDLYESVSIKKEARDVLVSDLELQDSAGCGDSLTLSGTVYNVGYRDETRVKVTLENAEFGIKLEQEFKTMDSGDSEDFSFTFAVPKNATEKNYDIKLRTFYDYDKSNENYDESSTYFTKVLKVAGNCVKPVVNNAAWTVAPNQLDEATQGKEVTIKATLQNTGSQSSSYVISLSGYESFATVTSIEPTTTVLAPGMSQDVSITLKLNSDAEGTQTFNIKASSSGMEKSQAVSFTVSPKSSILPSSLTSNWIIWVIILVNIILIVAIIIVAVRMARS